MNSTNNHFWRDKKVRRRRAKELVFFLFSCISSIKFKTNENAHFLKNDKYLLKWQRLTLQRPWERGFLTNDNSRIDLIAIFSHSETFWIVFGSSHTRHKSSWWWFDVEAPLQVDSSGWICQTGIIIAHRRHDKRRSFSLANDFELSCTQFSSWCRFLTFYFTREVTHSHTHTQIVVSCLSETTFECWK